MFSEQFSIIYHIIGRIYYTTPIFICQQMEYESCMKNARNALKGRKIGLFYKNIKKFRLFIKFSQLFSSNNLKNTAKYAIMESKK